MYRYVDFAVGRIHIYIYIDGCVEGTRKLGNVDRVVVTHTCMYRWMIHLWVYIPFLELSHHPGIFGTRYLIEPDKPMTETVREDLRITLFPHQ